jgi:hypothetical protein
MSPPPSEATLRARAAAKRHRAETGLILMLTLFWTTYLVVLR